MKTIGLYIHVPFCAQKCAYCDFYSHLPAPGEMDRCTQAICRQLSEWQRRLPDTTAATIYFGGGTPSLLGCDRLHRILTAARTAFGEDQREITVECDPQPGAPFDFKCLADMGVNRVSIGVQTLCDDLLHLMNRSHTGEEALSSLQQAKKAGIEHVNADLMLALPGQTKEMIRQAAESCIRYGASHLSAYLLKIEEKTVFYRRRRELPFPDEEEAAEQYEYLCRLLKEQGFCHYEISNFCLPGEEGQHNLIYWHDEEYLGLGPGAHSFLNGKRFFVPRNMQRFYAGETVPDGDGGSEEEAIMLCLRLQEGLRFEAFEQRFGHPVPARLLRKAAPLRQVGLLQLTDSSLSLTESGFLLSNSIITELLS